MSERMSDKAFENGEYLFSMMSFAKDEYIEEMLSDAQAEEIRAANLRSNITVERTDTDADTEKTPEVSKPTRYNPKRIALTACAAAFAVVIGINIFSGIGRMNTDSATTKKAESPVTAVDNGAMAKGEAEEAREAEDAAPDTAAAADNKGDEKKSGEVYGEETLEGGDMMMLPETDDDDTTNGDTKRAASVLLKADNGMTYRILGKAAASHKGEKVTVYKPANAQTEQDIYRFDDFEPDTLTMLDIGSGEYRLLIKSVLSPSTADDLYSGFKFDELLHCESGESNGTALVITEEEFRDTYMPVMFANPEEMLLTDEYTPQSGDYSMIMHCWLGTEEEKYFDLDLTLYRSSRLVIEIEGTKYTFEAQVPSAIFD